VRPLIVTARVGTSHWDGTEFFSVELAAVNICTALEVGFWEHGRGRGSAKAAYRTRASEERAGKHQNYFLDALNHHRSETCSQISGSSPGLCWIEMRMLSSGYTFS